MRPPLQPLSPDFDKLTLQTLRESSLVIWTHQGIRLGEFSGIQFVSLGDSSSKLATRYTLICYCTCNFWCKFVYIGHTVEAGHRSKEVGFETYYSFRLLPLFHGYPISMVTMFPWLPFQLPGDTIARFVNQLFIVMELSDGVERGKGCWAADPAVAASPRESCRGFS